MSDEKAFLTAIAANPLDDAPRLVYADWLDEQGDPAKTEHAEFIRVQCEMALLPVYDPRYAVLEQRANAILASWQKEWRKPFPGQRNSLEFWRGFPLPSLAKCSVTQLSKLTASDLQAAPLWRYQYGMNAANLGKFLRVRLLPRITTLSLRSSRLPKNWAQRIADCAGLRNVTELAFTDCPLTMDDLKVILDAWTDRRLIQLWVNSCQIGDAGIRLIAKHPATVGLRLLRAHTAGFTSRGVKAIADGPNLDGVTLATFAHNPIGDTGGRHLLRWKALEGIRELYLMNTGLSPTMLTRFHKRLGQRVHL